MQSSGTSPKSPNDDTGYGRVQVSKLITSVDAGAKLTDPARVAQLMDEYDHAVVYGAPVAGKKVAA